MEISDLANYNKYNDKPMKIHQYQQQQQKSCLITTEIETIADEKPELWSASYR